ncbi:MAG: 6-phosphogluconolactonase [Egibacteraceae bacterium]
MEVQAVAAAEVGGTAAALVAGELQAAVAARGRATLALSGGTTPAAMLTALAARRLPWEHIHVLQVDERVARGGSPDRNMSMLAARLLDAVAIPATNVHPMAVTDPDLDAAADRYAALLRVHAGNPARLDVVHLGVGSDGHTASLAPGEEAVQVSDRDVAVTGFYRGYRRMTMTLPLLSRARWTLWLVTGGHKAGVVGQLVAGDASIPAARVHTERATLVADLDAAALVGSSAHR